MDAGNVVHANLPNVDIPLQNQSSPGGFKTVDNLTFTKKVTNDDGKMYTITITFKSTAKKEEIEKSLKNIGENAKKTVETAINLGLGTTKEPSEAKPLRKYTITSMQFQLGNNSNISMTKTKTGLDGIPREKVSGLKDPNVEGKIEKRQRNNDLLNEIKSVFMGNINGEIVQPLRNPGLANQPQPLIPREQLSNVPQQQLNQAQPLQPPVVQSNQIASTVPLNDQECNDFISKHSEDIKSFLHTKALRNLLPLGINKEQFENINKGGLPKNVNLTKMFENVDNKNAFINVFKNSDLYITSEAKVFIKENETQITEALSKFSLDMDKDREHINEDVFDKVSNQYGFHKGFVDIDKAIQVPKIFVEQWKLNNGLVYILKNSTIDKNI